MPSWSLLCRVVVRGEVARASGYSNAYTARGHFRSRKRLRALSSIGDRNEGRAAARRHAPRERPHQLHQDASHHRAATTSTTAAPAAQSRLFLTFAADRSAVVGAGFADSSGSAASAASTLARGAIEITNRRCGAGVDASPARGSARLGTVEEGIGAPYGTRTHVSALRVCRDPFTSNTCGSRKPLMPNENVT